MTRVEKYKYRLQNTPMMASEPFHSKRRKVLKKIGAGGALTLPNTVVGKSSNSVRIAVVRGGTNKRPVLTKKVPKEWHAHEKSIEHLLKSVVNPLLEEEYVVGGSLVNSNREKDGLAYSQIKVELTEDASQAQLESIPDSLEEAGVNVPKEVKVTNIVTERSPGKLELGGCYADSTEDPSPGGRAVEAEGGGSGTSGFRVTDTSNNTQYLFTANHVLADGCQICASPNCTGGKDEGLYDVEFNYLGEGTGKNDVDHDWILVDSDSGVDYSDKIYTYSDTKDTVDGYLTHDGEDYVQSNNEVVEKFGNTTGYSYGYVKETDKYVSAGCIYMFYKATKISTDMGDGDSGGPIYVDWDSDETTAVYGVNQMYGGDTSTVENCDGNDATVGTFQNFYPFFRVASNNSYTTGSGGIEP